MRNTRKDRAGTGHPHLMCLVTWIFSDLELRFVKRKMHGDGKDQSVFESRAFTEAYNAPIGLEKKTKDTLFDLYTPVGWMY